MLKNDEIRERVASLLAAAITSGVKDVQASFSAVYCPVSGDDEKETALLSLMATQARLTATEIVLGQAGVPALGVSYSNLSDLIFEVRRATIITHIVSKALSLYDAKNLFPEMRLEEVLNNDWEKELSAGGLAKALKSISKLTGQQIGKK